MSKLNVLLSRPLLMHLRSLRIMRNLVQPLGLLLSPSLTLSSRMPNGMIRNWLVLFSLLKNYCWDVKGGRFDAHIPAAKFNKLDGVCRSVYSYLDILRWKQVRGLHENPNEDALKPDKFKDYAEWLEKHLPEIKKSMINMHNETGKYSGRQLQTNMKKLVSKYGFVCNGDWYTGIVPLFDARGKGALTFLEAFDYLRKTLDKVLKNAPTKSTEA